MREFATLLEQWPRCAQSCMCLWECVSGMLVVIQGVSVVFCLLQEEARFILVWESTGLSDY